MFLPAGHLNVCCIGGMRKVIIIVMVQVCGFVIQIKKLFLATDFTGENIALKVPGIY